jgi:hypothetical protein
MKIKILLTLLAISSFAVNAQNGNPYQIFGYKSKVIYEETKEDFFRVANSSTNDSIKFIVFNFSNKTVQLLDLNDSVKQTLPIESERLLRWLSVDPLASKYSSSSPYNFVDNNPIMRVDPDGRDWIVATSQVNGKTQIKLTFAGAIVNNSGKSIDMQSLIDNQIKQFEAVFGQGNVTANLMLREVASASDIKWHESLIDIQAGSNFGKTESGGVAGGDSRYGGKYIRINADGINNNGSLVDNKTIVHEMGHTGGLMHPWEFGSKEKTNFVNGNVFSEGIQGFYNSENSLQLDANFMGYSSKTAAKSQAFGMSTTQEQRINYLNKNVGRATQGQTQQIIDNLYRGNLNSGKDIPKK